MSTRDLITAHAMVRWLERGEGRDLGVLRAAFLRMRGRDAEDGELLDFLGSYTGESLGEIRRRIWTPALATAIDLGARAVRRGPVWLIIEGGRVVTVLYRRREILMPARRGAGRSTKGRRTMRGWVGGDWV